MAFTPKLTYKGKPLVRKDNELYYGRMTDPYVLYLQILTTTPVGDQQGADKVHLMLLSTDTTKAPQDYTQARFSPDCWLFFGKETAGLPEDFRKAHYDRCIRRLLLGVTLYIATATAMVGPLAFLGLIIANLSRQFLRTYRHSQLITGSVLFGMAVLIGGQLRVERVFVYSVPVSVFITVGGGVYFLYLLLTQRKA